MANKIKQAVDDNGKPVYLNLSNAKYITLKDDFGKHLKKGSKWLGWSTPVVWFRLKDGQEIETKYPNMYDVYANELGAALNNQIADAKSENWNQQKIETEKKRAELDKTMKKLVEESAKKAVSSKTPQGSTKAPSSHPDNGAVKSNAQTPQARPQPIPVKQSVTPQKQAGTLQTWDSPPWSDNELTTLYNSFQKMQGRSTKIGKKELDAMKGTNEFRDELDAFLDYGLKHKGAVPDDAIPPLAILRKIPALPKEMVLYYERKLSKKGSEDGKFKQVMQSAMPKSWKAAWGAAKMGGSAVKWASDKAGLSTKIGSAVEKLKSPFAGGLTSNEKESGITPKMEKDNSKTDRYKEHKMEEDNSKTDRYKEHTGMGKVDKAVMNFLGDAFKQLKKTLEERLPKKTTTKSPENTSFANEAEFSDTTHNSETGHTETGHTETKGEGGKSGDGLFGKIGGMFKSLLKPLSLLKLAFKALTSLIPSIGRILIAGLGKLLSSLGGTLLRALGPLAAVAGAAFAGYKIGEKLNEKFGISDKISNFFSKSASQVDTDYQNSPDVKAKHEELAKKFEAAGVSKESVEAFRKDPNNILASKEYQTIKKVSVSNAESLKSAPKSNATVVSGAADMKDELKNAKDEKKSQVPVVVQAPISSNNVATGGNGVSVPNTPRTSNSTFHRYFDSKTHFAY